MSFLTDAEQRQLNDELIDGPTTQKINKKVSAAEERILKQLAPVVEQVFRHENFLAGLSKKMTESFSGLLRLDEKLNGKK